jgi:HEAT repeat protein
MKLVSDETQELIQQLRQRSSVVGRLFGDRSVEADLIRRIASAGEPASVFHLLPFTSRGDAIAEAAASAIGQIVSTVPVLKLVDLDYWARGAASYESHRWNQLQPADVLRLARLSDRWAVLTIAAMHRSGYVREAALRQLAAAPSGKLLPILLIRLNDWVGPVRRAAEGAVEALRRAPDPEALVACLPLLLQMQTWRRRDLQPFVDSLLQLLQQPGSRRALASGLRSPDRYVRRESLRLALTTPELDPAEAARFLEDGLADGDILVRLQAARHLQLLDDGTLRRLGAMARGDRSMPVGRAALEACAARFPAEAVSLYQDALLDAHASIRQLARHRLEKQPGGFGVAEFYRAAVRSQSGTALRAAILGLAETGEAGDAVDVLPFSSHEIVRVREAAVRALGRLDAENWIDVILKALADPSRRVSKQARVVLEAHPTLPIEDWAWEIVGSDAHPVQGRLNALHVLSRRPRWASLPFVVRAVLNPGPEVAAAAREHVLGWLATRQRSFRKPTPEQAREVRQALEEAGKALEPALTDAIRDEIAFWLGAAGETRG